jgi:hypothetical protein
MKGFPAFEDQTGVDDQGNTSIYLTSEYQLVGSYNPFSGVEEYDLPCSAAYHRVFPYSVTKIKNKRNKLFVKRHA